MKVLVFLALAIAGSASAILLGGVGSQDTCDALCREAVYAVRGNVEQRVRLTYDVFEPTAMKKQVVAGLNLFVKVNVGEGNYVHLRIYLPLAGSDEAFYGSFGRPQLSAVKTGMLARDVLDYFEDNTGTY